MFQSLSDLANILTGQHSILLLSFMNRVSTNFYRVFSVTSFNEYC